MESSNNSEDKAPIRPLLLSSKTSSAKNGLHLIELLAKKKTMETPKQLRLWPSILVALPKLMVRHS